MNNPIFKYKSIRAIILASISVIILQSCSYSNYKFLNSYESSETPNVLSLKPGTELLMLREDIYRETSTKEVSTSDSTKKTETVDVSYHPMGFHICKGVFLDINENIFVNIAELFNLTDSSDFQITQEVSTIFGKQKYVVKKEGNEIKRIRDNLLGDDVDKITIEEGKIKIKELGLFSSTNTITESNDKLTYDKSILNWFPETITKKDDNTYNVKIGFNNNKVSQNTPNLIEYNKILDIKWNNKNIEFDYRFYRNPLLLVKVIDGYLFDDSKGNLVRIKIENDSIEVWHNKKLYRTYTLKK